MKNGLYRKLAWNNIRKNQSTFLPFGIVASCVVAVLTLRPHRKRQFQMAKMYFDFCGYYSMQVYGIIHFSFDLPPILFKQKCQCIGNLFIHHVICHISAVNLMIDLTVFDEKNHSFRKWHAKSISQSC